MSQAPSPRILPCDPRLQHQVARCVLISVEMGTHPGKLSIIERPPGLLGEQFNVVLRTRASSALNGEKTGTP